MNSSVEHLQPLEKSDTPGTAALAFSLESSCQVPTVFFYVLHAFLTQSEASNFSEPNHPNKPTKARRSEQERRLLGQSGHEADPDAVPIAIPRSRTSQEDMPIPGGGPRPTNTLVDNQSNPRSVLGAVCEFGGDLFNRFNSPWSKLSSSQQNGSEHPSKRVKVTHSSSTRAKHTHDEEDPDGFDVLSEDGNENGQCQTLADRARLGASVTSSRFPKPNPMLRTASSEHATVEAMMDSSKHARQAEEEARRRRGRLSRSLQSRKSQMQPRELWTDAIDLTGSEASLDETPIVVPWKGTATPTRPAVPGTFGRGSLRQRGTGKTSEFFERKANSSSIATQRDSCISIGTERSEHAEQQNIKLAQQFMPASGKRRGSDIGVSSDELGEVNDYSRVTRVPPEKTSAQLSSFKQRRGDASPTMLSEMEPSNIEATLFTDSNRKQAMQTSRLKKQKREEPPKETGFEAKTVIIGDKYFDGSVDGLGLVFNEDNTVLEVLYNGRNLTHRYSGIGVLIRALHAILWAPGCLKVRLECTRRSDQASPHVDIELISERNIAKLIKELESRTPGIKIITKDSPHMEKIFKKRLAELPLNHRAAHDETFDDDPETQVYEQSKKPQGESSPENLQETLGNTMRKRAGSRMVDKLTSRPSPTSGEPVKTVVSRLSHSRPITESREAAKTSRTLTKIDAVLHRVNDQRRDSYPARSTRSAAAADDAAVDVDDSFSYAQELPEELRYSKIHGLGTRWKKALIYPKTGKKKTTVDFDDLERLDDGQFLNDNLIGFYLRYLECNLVEKKPEMVKNIYWFNTYFFASLTQTARGKRGINYEAVRKWTREIDIFSYDYAVVPINESAHWYVAIICNLRALNRMPEIDGWDGCSSPPPKSFDAAEDTENVPEQSSLHSVGVVNPGKEVDELENQSARGTRESFAELRLEDGNTVRDQDTAIQAKGEALDDGKMVLVPSSQVELSSTPPESEKDRDTAVSGAPISAKTPTSQKKGRRKPVQSPRPLDPRQPAIITLDSLGLAHSPTVRALKDYLHAEMRDKRGGMEWDDQQMKGMTAKQIPLQDNYCDCGLFLLGYMDKFVENPKDFVTKLLQRGYDEKKDWPNLNPSAIRSDIRGLVQNLHAEQEDERVSSKTKSPLKNSAPMPIEEQKTQLSVQIVAEKQAPVNPTSTDRSLRILDQAETAGQERLERTTPTTREEALQTALRIDVTDPTPSKIPINGLPQHNPARHAESIADSAPDLPPIVLDSQEEPTAPAGATIHNIQDDDELLQAHLPEALMEIPDTPPRPKTRGKPTPDPEPPWVVASQTRGREAREAVRSTVQQDREVITIADN